MGSTTSYLCDLGQVICLALVSTEKGEGGGIIPIPTKKVCCLFKGDQESKVLGTRLDTYQVLKNFPYYCYYCCFTEYFLYWGGSRAPLPSSEHFHFWLNMPLAKNAEPIHSELNARHMSLLASTGWWEFRCGIPKPERVCVHIIHTYILNQRNEESKKWISHCERWKGPLSHLRRSRKGVNTCSLTELRRSFIAPLYKAHTSPVTKSNKAQWAACQREHPVGTAALGLFARTWTSLEPARDLVVTPLFSWVLRSPKPPPPPHLLTGNFFHLPEGQTYTNKIK